MSLALAKILAESEHGSPSSISPKIDSSSIGDGLVRSKEQKTAERMSANHSGFQSVADEIGESVDDVEDNISSVVDRDSRFSQVARFGWGSRELSHFIRSPQRLVGVVASGVFLNLSTRNSDLESTSDNTVVGGMVN